MVSIVPVCDFNCNAILLDHSMWKMGEDREGRASGGACYFFIFSATVVKTVAVFPVGLYFSNEPQKFCRKTLRILAVYWTRTFHSAFFARRWESRGLRGREDIAFWPIFLSCSVYLATWIFDKIFVGFSSPQKLYQASSDLVNCPRVHKQWFFSLPFQCKKCTFYFHVALCCFRKKKRNCRGFTVVVIDLPWKFQWRRRTSVLSDALIIHSMMK